MKVIFLDVDGVLNSVRSMYALNKKYRANLASREMYTPDKINCHIDDIAVGLVNKICEEFDVRLVISSTHRKHVPEGDLKALKQYFACLGLTGEVVGATPSSYSGFRGSEIAYYLDTHKEITTYAILDDSDDMLSSQMPFFVHTSCEEGMSLANYRQLEEIFGPEA